MGKIIQIFIENITNIEGEYLVVNVFIKLQICKYLLFLEIDDTCVVLKNEMLKTLKKLYINNRGAFLCFFKCTFYLMKL